MRVLFASTQGAGHFTPLVPFAQACLRLGHDVLVSGPASLADRAAQARLPFWRFDDPPRDELDDVWSQVPALSPEQQNEVVIGEIFARLDASASLPRLREACRGWRPDVVVREPNEYGSAIAAELQGIPHARVAIGLAAMEGLALRIAAARVDELRRTVGLPADPRAAALRSSPYLTLFPSSFEDPAEPAQPFTLRFRDAAWDEPPSRLPEPLTAGDEPLVYVTFGSVAGGMEAAAHAYEAAVEALAELSVRALLTVGDGADLKSFAGAPANVTVERWVPQADVLARAAAVVCHGGSGSTLGALAAGVPLVVVPLFADQPHNARRVSATGAGVAVAADAAEIRLALRRVLEEDSFRSGARAVAAELRAQPSIDAAVEALVGLTRTAP